MKTHRTKLQTMLAGVIEKAKVRKGLLSIPGIFFVLQVYFVREFLAAELLFGLGFAVLWFWAGFSISSGHRRTGFDWAATGVRVIATSARRGYAGLEELSRKPFRHPRSESAQ